MKEFLDIPEKEQDNFLFHDEIHAVANEA